MRKVGFIACHILLVLALSVPSTTGAESAAQTAFADISTHWAKASIEQAVTKGYVNGYPDHTFKPNASVSRAEFVKMLANALHLQLPEASGKWYEPYVQAMQDAALLRDGDLGSDWSQPLPRLEMAKLLVRGSDDSVRGKSLSDGEWLYRAATKGLIAGMDDGTLNETGPTTRAQATVVIERLFTLREGGTLPTDHNAISNAAILFKGSNAEEEGFAKPIALPAKLDFGPQVDVTLDKMVVIDLDDPKAPYRKALEGFTVKSIYNGMTFKSNAYFVALHFVIENKKVQKGDWSFTGNKIYSDAPITGFHWSYVQTQEESDKFPFYIVLTTNLAKVGKQDGWYLLAINKDFLKTSPFGNQILVYNAYDHDNLYLTQQN